jgi:serine protease
MASSIPQQSPAQTTPAPVPAQTKPAPVPAASPGEPHPRVCVKLNAAAQIQQRADPKYLAGVLDAAQPGSSNGAKIESLYAPLKSEDLDALMESAKQNDQTYAAKNIDLHSWYQVILPYPYGAEPNGTGISQQAMNFEAERLVAALQKRPEVDKTYPLRCGSPPSPSVSVDGYLDAPGDMYHGLDISTWNQYPGGNGAGINLVDIEAGWDYTGPAGSRVIAHQALPKNQIHHCEPSLPDDFNLWKYHGMNVLGMLFMQPQTSNPPSTHDGWTGIAKGGNGYTMGIRFAEGVNIAKAICQAILPNPEPGCPLLGPGDVILLEYQIPGDGVDNIPVESEAAVKSMIETAVSKGITVIEAAGNGNNKLDTIAGLDGSAANDSGAIMVGGCTSTTLAPWTTSPIQGTNYGKRIDVFAWAENVCTTGADHDNEDPNPENQANCYRPDSTPIDDPSPDPFGGTSSAAAIIAGAVMVIQGIVKEKLGSPLSPADIRTLLKNPINSTASASSTSQNPADGNIGVMPNLTLCLAAKGILPS